MFWYHFIFLRIAREDRARFGREHIIDGVPKYMNTETNVATLRAASHK